MLPKKNRITVRDFRKSPYPFNSFRTPVFHIIVKRTHNPIPRIAIIVPKSVDKRSSHRNKSKRIVSQVLQTILSLHQLHACDIQINIKKIIEKSNRQEKEKELLQALMNLGVVNKT